jgi:hypothetical protein
MAGQRSCAHRDIHMLSHVAGREFDHGENGDSEAAEEAEELYVCVAREVVSPAELTAIWQVSVAAAEGATQRWTRAQHQESYWSIWTLNPFQEQLLAQNASYWRAAQSLHAAVSAGLLDTVFLQAFRDKHPDA